MYEGGNGVRFKRQVVMWDAILLVQIGQIVSL